MNARMNAIRQIGCHPAYRTIFISDTHLGTRGCRSDFLADFLRQSSCHNLFLVGDIIDGWRLRKSWYWDEQPRRGAEADRAPRPRRHRGHLHPRQPRRDVSQLAADRPGNLRHQDAPRSRAHHRRRQAPAGDARRRIRQRRALCQVPRAARRLGLHHRAGASTAGSTPSAAVWAIPTGRCRPG